MEKEIILFEKMDLPIKLHHLNMRQGFTYRGMHSHVAIEIVEVKNGELCCYINDEVLRLYPKDIIFINSNIRHRLCSENAEIFYMHIDVNFFTESIDDLELPKLYEFISHTTAKPYLIFSDHKEIQEILFKINARYDEGQASNRWYIKAYMYELIAFMYSQGFITPPTIAIKQIEKIKPVVQYIDDHFRIPITLDDISNAVNYNKFAVCHCFKAVTGATVFEYINFLRVHYAIEKLKQKDNLILAIATDSGFSSPTYFNRVFKSVVGCAPSAYRKFHIENALSE